MWVVFIACHLYYGWVSSWHASVPMNDVTGVYRGWLDRAAETGSIPGVHEPFVYPVASLLPMWLADLIGGHAHYGTAWLLIVLLLDLAALWWLTLRNRGAAGAGLRRAAAWFWVAFMIAIGPIGIGRIDAITVPFALVGMLSLRERAMGAGAALTFAAWIKVWPAAPFAAAFVVIRRRGRLVIGAVLACLAVLLPIMLLVDGWRFEHLTSFVAEQTGRGLQVESLGASLLLMLAAFGAGGYRVYFDQQILTTQIEGPGSAAIASALTPLMFVVILALLGFGFLAARGGTRFARLYPSLTLALVATFILVNKVGSPQFFTWLAPVIVVGLVWDFRWFRWVALLGLLVALLTQVIYPWYYGWVTAGIPWAAFTLLLRNLLVLAMLVLAVVRMVPRGARSPAAAPTR
ncbi:Integral membrane protein [Gulosibacter sp. 10]|nr:Integral membrane protein [Gulosibacter sp. 10]